jgi:hypothetical protein
MPPFHRTRDSKPAVVLVSKHCKKISPNLRNSHITAPRQSELNYNLRENVLRENKMEKKSLGLSLTRMRLAIVVWMDRP